MVPVPQSWFASEARVDSFQSRIQSSYRSSSRSSGMQATGFAAPYPYCRSLDLVRKVSAVVAAETSHGGRVGHPIPMRSSQGAYNQFATTLPHGQQQTVLARRLAPPGAPKPKKWLDSNLFFFGIVCVIGLVIYWSILLAAIASLSLGLSPTLTALLLVGILLSVMTLIICLRGVVDIRGMNRRAAIHWAQQIDTWNCSLYCGRCDAVFSSPTCSNQ